MSTSTTQQEHPLRAAARTFVQSWLPQIAAVLILAPLVVGAITDTAAEYDIVLPDSLGLALAGIVTGCAALSALLARLMAIPGVDTFLERFRLGSTPALAAGYPVALYSTHDEVILTDGAQVRVGSIIMDRKADVASYTVHYASGQTRTVRETDIARRIAGGQ